MALRWLAVGLLQSWRRAGVKIVLITLAAGGFSLLWASDNLIAAPYVSSQYYCLVDANTGQTMLSKNAARKRPVASTTKMMTAILVRDYADLDETAVVSKNASQTPPFTIGLRENQTISVEELLKAALIRSANDAAVVLAEHVAGDESLFGHLMSQKALIIGAADTHFVNASGLPASDHYSTALDLAQMGRYLLADPVLSRLVATRQTDFGHPSYRQPYTIYNTNTLLDSFPGASGIKTGTTDAAGKCLVASATRGQRSLIAVALRSGDRASDCARLLEYGFNAFGPWQVIDRNQLFKQVRVKNGNSLWAEAFPRSSLFILKGQDSPAIEKKVHFQYLAEAPLVKGQQLGYIEVYADKKIIAVVPLECRQEVEVRRNIFNRAKDLFSGKGNRARREE